MTTFRPRSARFTAVAIVVVALAVTVSHVVSSGPREAIPTVGLAVLACVFGIFVYWHPCVRADDATVEIVNVLSTVTVPLARIVHVDTRWAMEIYLDDGMKVSAFAAPAPGVHGARNIRPGEFKRLPTDTYVDRTVRVGDKPGTASGDAALLVRTNLQAWRESGANNARTAVRRPHITAHVALACGIAAAVGGFLI